MMFFFLKWDDKKCFIEYPYIRLTMYGWICTSNIYMVNKVSAMVFVIPPKTNMVSKINYNIVELYLKQFLP